MDVIRAEKCFNSQVHGHDMRNNVQIHRNFSRGKLEMRYFVLISMFILYFVKLLIIAMILVYICTLFSLMTGFFLQCTIDGNNTLIFFQDFLNFSRYFFKSLYIIYQSARNFMMISNMYNLMFISSIP